MTREQAKKMLISFGIEAPTDEQITNYLNSVNGEVQKEKTKSEADKAELERLKQVEADLQAEKNKNLSAEEQLQAALAAAEQSKKEFSVRSNRLEVEKILVSAGLSEEDYRDIIDSMVTEDLESSTKLATGFTGILKTKKEAAEKALKEELLKDMPAPTGGTDGDEPKTEDVAFAEELAASMTGGKTESKSVFENY